MSRRFPHPFKRSAPASPKSVERIRGDLPPVAQAGAVTATRYAAPAQDRPCERCKGRGWICLHCAGREDWHHAMDCTPGTEQPCHVCSPALDPTPERARRIVIDWCKAAETPRLLPGGGAELSLIRAAAVLLAELDRCVDVERGYVAELALLGAAFREQLGTPYVEPDQAGAIVRRAVGE